VTPVTLAAAWFPAPRRVWIPVHHGSCQGRLPLRRVRIFSLSNVQKFRPVGRGRSAGTSSNRVLPDDIRSHYSVGFDAAPTAFFSHPCLDFVGRLWDFIIAVEAASFHNAR